MLSIARWRLEARRAMKKWANGWYRPLWITACRHIKSQKSHLQHTSVTCISRDRGRRKVQKAKFKLKASHHFRRVKPKTSTPSQTSLTKNTIISPLTLTSTPYSSRDQGWSTTSQPLNPGSTFLSITSSLSPVSHFSKTCSNLRCKANQTVSTGIKRVT